MTDMILDTLAGAVRTATPLLLAGLGGVISERSGVINIALEGHMLAGACGAALGTALTGSVAAGLLIGVLAALLTAALHAAACVKWRAEPIVAGIAICLLADAGTQATVRAVTGAKGASPPLQGLVPPLILGFSPFTWLAFAGVPVLAWWLRATRGGLRLRACGEAPGVVDAGGVRVTHVRAGALLAAGVLAGLGGCYLAFDAGSFARQMAGGRGYLALALVILGKWRPGGVLLGAALLGLLTAARSTVPAVGALPPQLADLLPYVATLVVLAGFVGKSVAPAALGRPWPED
ncbi:MAG: ABC transporter permease [Planctomycetota bacterium]|jgi:simple sugar transport system permease protein